MRRLVLNIVIVFCVQAKIQAQQTQWLSASKEEVVASYKKICDWFINTTSYSFEMKYSSFKSHASNELIESSEGYYKRLGKKYASLAVGVKTIQNEKIRIVVDSADKIIAVTDPGTLSPTIQGPEDLVKLLENVKSLKKKTALKTTCYRIDFNKNELFEAYEFVVNDRGLLEKLVYYYSEQIEKEYGDGEKEKPYEKKIKPRLEILFSNYFFPGKFSDRDFIDKAVVLASNNKVTLLDKYKSYQVKDYRQIKK